MITKRREISFKKTNLKRRTRDLYNKEHLSLSIKVNVVMYFCRTRTVDLEGIFLKASKSRRRDYSKQKLFQSSYPLLAIVLWQA